MIERFTDYHINWDLMTIGDDKVHLWHYSSIDIEDDYIRIGKSQQYHSTSEYKAWGKSRAFFYGVEDGYKWDKIGTPKYKYFCTIDLDKIYDINLDPNNYKNNRVDRNFFYNIYYQSVDDGFTSWIYNLDGNGKCPIVISFKDVEILNKYKLYGGEWRDINEPQIDKEIGYVIVNKNFPEWVREDKLGESAKVMMPWGAVDSIINSYLLFDDGTKFQWGSHVYLHPYIKTI
jgi:hypothetical protein